MYDGVRIIIVGRVGVLKGDIFRFRDMVFFGNWSLIGRIENFFYFLLLGWLRWVISKSGILLGDL